MFEWAYNGINASIPRNIGPECAGYLSMKRRIIETILVAIFISFLMRWSLKRMTVPKLVPYEQQGRKGRVFLLVIMTLVFGVEIGFKLSGQTFVYILNPCHIYTIVEIYLLAAEPSSPVVTVIFRLVVSSLNGPFLAFVFPETDCRPTFVDKALYYIQHGLMVVVPYYLMRLGGVYNIEPFFDLSWSIFGYALNLAYHFSVLQVTGLLVQVNLSHMLCAAILDPFEGQNYRVWAICHQMLLVPLLYKLFCITSYFLFTKFPLTRVKGSLNSSLVNNIPNKTELTHETLLSFKGCENGHKHCN